MKSKKDIESIRVCANAYVILVNSPSVNVNDVLRIEKSIKNKMFAIVRNYND